MDYAHDQRDIMMARADFSLRIVLIVVRRPESWWIRFWHRVLLGFDWDNTISETLGNVAEGSARRTIERAADIDVTVGLEPKTEVVE